MVTGHSVARHASFHGCRPGILLLGTRVTVVTGHSVRLAVDRGGSAGAAAARDVEPTAAADRRGHRELEAETTCRHRRRRHDVTGRRARRGA